MRERRLGNGVGVGGGGLREGGTLTKNETEK